ncbi:7-deoxyloganetin glucosyltransferase [Bienertia sinuspersici]
MVSKCHVVCVPFPAQGHITPMLQFAKLLHSFGFHITFVNTVYNHKRFLKSHGSEALNGLPNFQFMSIPNGLLLPSSDKEATQDIIELCKSTNRACLGPFRDLVESVNKEGTHVTCIVADAVMHFTFKVAVEFGIPMVAFWTMSACGYMGYMHYHTLADRGYFPMKCKLLFVMKELCRL